MQQTTGTNAVPTRETAPAATPAAGERPAVLDLPVPTGVAPAGTPIFDALLAQRRTTFALATRAERGSAATGAGPAKAAVKAANAGRGAQGGLPTQQTGPAVATPAPAAEATTEPAEKPAPQKAPRQAAAAR